MLILIRASGQLVLDIRKFYNREQHFLGISFFVKRAIAHSKSGGVVTTINLSLRYLQKLLKSRKYMADGVAPCTKLKIRIVFIKRLGGTCRVTAANVLRTAAWALVHTTA